MASYLAEHPAIFWSDPKELWYFCRPDFPDNGKLKKLEHYLQHFSASNANHRYLAEGSTSYLYAPGAVARVLEFNPEAHFIVMLRNPIEAVVSLHRQMLLNMQESESDFERAWRLQDARRNGHRVPFKCSNYKYLMYRDWCLWGEQLERLFRVVERTKVCVILFDDFKQNAQAEYEKVLSFLELEAYGRTEFLVENRSRSFRHQYLINGIDNFLVAISALREKLKLRPPGIGLSRALRKLQMSQLQPAKSTTLSKDIQTQLREAFAADVALLSRLLQRDLSYWLQAASHDVIGL